MRQCLVGKEKEAMLDNNRECQAALEVLLVSPLYDCRCKRGMKKELQCLQNYWTIHMGLTEGRRHMDGFTIHCLTKFKSHHVSLCGFLRGRNKTAPR